MLLEFLNSTGYGFKSYLAIGGSNSASQTVSDLAEIRELGPDILVGTPGRLEDLLCGRKKKGPNGIGVKRTSPVMETKELEVLIFG